MAKPPDADAEMACSTGQRGSQGVPDDTLIVDKIPREQLAEALGLPVPDAPTEAITTSAPATASAPEPEPTFTAKRPTGHGDIPTEHTEQKAATDAEAGSGLDRSPTTHTPTAAAAPTHTQTGTATAGGDPTTQTHLSSLSPTPAPAKGSATAAATGAAGATASGDVDPATVPPRDATAHTGAPSCDATASANVQNAHAAGGSKVAAGVGEEQAEASQPAGLSNIHKSIQASDISPSTDPLL